MSEAKKKGDGNLANNAKPYDKITRGDVIAGRLGKDEKGGKTMKEAKAKCCCEDKGKMKCPVHKPMNEAERTMSRAAKGYEKYGKAGMTALAKAGREGKDLDKVRDKYNKYDEGSMPMKKVNGKSVPAFAADGKGKNDLSKKKDVKETAAAAMWKNIKETTAYVAEKAEVEKKAKRDYDEDGTIETGKAEHAGSVDKAIKANKAKETVKESVDMTRLRELTKHLLG